MIIYTSLNQAGRDYLRSELETLLNDVGIEALNNKSCFKAWVDHVEERIENWRIHRNAFYVEIKGCESKNGQPQLLAFETCHFNTAEVSLEE